MCEFVVFFVTSNEKYFKQLHNYTIRSISSDIVVLGLLCCMTAGDARITQLCQWIKLFLPDVFPSNMKEYHAVV